MSELAMLVLGVLVLGAAALGFFAGRATVVRETPAAPQPEPTGGRLDYPSPEEAEISYRIQELMRMGVPEEEARRIARAEEPLA